MDTVSSMVGKGQYIYVSVNNSEPVIKFNNGFEGGGHEILFNEANQAHPGGAVVGMYENTLRAHVLAAMQPISPPSFIESDFTSKVEYEAWLKDVM